MAVIVGVACGFGYLWVSAGRLIGWCLGWELVSLGVCDSVCVCVSVYSCICVLDEGHDVAQECRTFTQLLATHGDRDLWRFLIGTTWG